MTRKQPELFDFPPGYPQSPGFNETDTSKAAARTMTARAVTLCGQVYELLRTQGGYTVHEAAIQLHCTVASIQPRFSELRAQGMVYDSGKRRVNADSGKRAIVWEAQIYFKAEGQ